MKKRKLFLVLAAAALLAGCGQEKENFDVAGGKEVLEEEVVFPSREEENPASGKTEKGAVFEGESAGFENQGTASSDEEKAAEIAEVLDSLEFGYSAIKLSHVTKLLDERKIQYAGYYNQTRERLDVVLEDGTSLLFLETRDSNMEPAGFGLMMKGEEFCPNDFQEDYLNCYDVISEEYFYPDFSERLWTEGELWSFNQTDLSIARNQIFAVHGRKFKDSFLNAVFSQKSWYTPLYSGEEFEAMGQEILTDIERENLKTVIRHESQRGLSNSGAGDLGQARGLLSGSWIDLDGDGQKEQIFYQVEEQFESDGWKEIQKVSLKAQDGEQGCGVFCEGGNLQEECYIAYMEGELPFLIVADNGVSADYVMNFYHYVDGELLPVGTIYAPPEELEIYPGRMEAYEETYHLQCQPVKFTYILVDGSLVKREEEYYDYQQNIVTVKKETALYSQKEGEEAALILLPGDQVQVMGGDLSQWVMLKKVPSGECGWLKVEGADCQLTDGSTVYSEELFEGLQFYG